MSKITHGILERKVARLARMLKLPYTRDHGSDGVYLERERGVGYRVLIFKDGKERAPFLPGHVGSRELWNAIEFAEQALRLAGSAYGGYKIGSDGSVECATAEEAVALSQMIRAGD